MRQDDLRSNLLECLDKKLLVLFQIGGGSVNTNAFYFDELLDLLAGADADNDDETLIDEMPGEKEQPTQQFEYEIFDFHNPDDDSVIFISSFLQNTVCAEVKRVKEATIEQQKKAFNARRIGAKTTHVSCPLCHYYKSFGDHRFQLLLRHLDQRHAWTQKISAKGTSLGKGFCVASGTKQIRILKAIFDNDALSGHYRSDYLRSSATLIREICHPNIPRTLWIDPFLILVFTCNGPRYELESKIPRLDYLKRSGMRGIYYDQKFAEWCYAEALILKGKMKTLRTRYIRRSQECNNKLWFDIHHAFHHPLCL